jgi:ubiquinol-cytochrome c reductase cytochrome b subunit
LLPFVLLFLVVLHVIFLHEKGSNKPLGLKSNGDKIFFHNFFSVKDFLGFFFGVVLINFFFLSPDSFMEYQNFLQANPLVTPTHIQPEWYFLPAYAVLRSIPKKLGGVISLVFFILVIGLFPLFSLKARYKNS